MYFQATLKGNKYHVEVFEQRYHWLVTIQEDGKSLETFRIPKKDYLRMDDAVNFIFNNGSYMIDAVEEGNEYTVYTRGSYRNIPLVNDEGLLHESLKGGGDLGGSDKLVAGMPGKIVDIRCAVGQEMKAKDTLLIMEAMKMENEMRAIQDVKIKEILVKPGQSVESGAVLIVFEK